MTGRKQEARSTGSDSRAAGTRTLDSDSRAAGTRSVSSRSSSARVSGARSSGARSSVAGATRPVPTLDMERALAAEGHAVVVGFDEVGRGALAGPAMVGCAAVRASRLPGLAVPDHLADSKMLTERRRETMFEPLKAWVDAWAVGEVSAHEIDDWGISYALGVAALRALDQVERSLGLGEGSASTVSGVSVGAILDGPNDYITKAFGTFDAPMVPVAPQVVTRVKGDQHCATVAAAAVIAKVTRDRLMMRLAQEHPEWDAYGWARNKGYGSAAHRAAIAELGTTPYHRLSWHLI